MPDLNIDNKADLFLRDRMQHFQIPNRFSILRILTMLLAVTTASCASTNGTHTSSEANFLRSIADLAPIEIHADEKLNVVATTNIAFDTLQNVGGDLIDLEALIPRGADPHAYEPSPGDLRKLVQADLVFINGIDLEEPLYPTFAEIATDTAIVSLSEGLDLQSFGDPEHEETEAQGETHKHTGDDPHVWLDPVNVQTWVRNAADALDLVDPNHADLYQSNAVAYTRELENLHRWIEQHVEKIPADRRKLVTDHRALGYFALRYDFELVAAVIPAYSTASEPSARELSELVDTIQEESVQAIFVGTNVNTTLAERIAQDTGIQVIPLYIGTLSLEDGPAGTYLRMMKYNVEAITAGLSGNE
jgi:ABC-type Zn uptake system ZnuABC Zn-binding protein ZnuA